MDKKHRIVKNTLSSNLIKASYSALNKHFTIKQIENMTIGELDGHLELIGKLQRGAKKIDY